MRRFPAVCSAILLAIGVGAPSGGASAKPTAIGAPVLTSGDTWTYANGNMARGAQRVTHDVVTLSRASSRLIVVEVHAVGQSAPGREHLFGPDWSIVRSVNGAQTVVNRPLSFPLAPGKSWSVSYSENAPADRTHTRETYEMTYTAAGWEDVTVPAGTFHALKIEGDGTWTAYLPGNVLVAKNRAANGATIASATSQGPRVASGRVLKTFWYVPEVARWVKSDEDTYSSTGAQTQQATSELEAYSVAQPSASGTPEADTRSDDAPPAPAHRAKTTHQATRKPAPAPVAPPKASPPPAPAPSPSLLQELRVVAPPRSPAGAGA